MIFDIKARIIQIMEEKTGSDFIKHEEVAEAIIEEFYDWGNIFIHIMQKLFDKELRERYGLQKGDDNVSENG